MPYAFGVAMAVALAACYTDVTARRIPNWLTMSGMAVGVVIHLGLSGFHGGLVSIEGLLLGFGLLIALFAKGGFGGGDVKLLMAIGALTGPLFLFGAFLFAAVLGAVFSLVLLLRKRMLGLALTGMAAQVSLTGLSIPYAVPIAAGVLLEIARESGLLF